MGSITTSTTIFRMYPSIQLAWSTSPSKAEAAYQSAGMVKTQGTVFLLPPDIRTLIDTYNAPPRPKTRMSAGAVALCKHFERGEASSEHGKAHPYWPLPKGSNENKSRLASEALERMLETTVWKNMMMLHRDVAVYECRNACGYGMRWTLDLEQQQNNGDESLQVNTDLRGSSDLNYEVKKVTFRGFLEPIVGLDHEIEAETDSVRSKMPHS